MRQSTAHTNDRDEMIQDTNRFGNHGIGTTENVSKIVKFGSVIIFCVLPLGAPRLHSYFEIIKSVSVMFWN